ncbi:tetratricopeptide repeat protein, partial [bacterium]|nr:tetratricopeptide repeat protein [bacterium]
QARIPIVFCLGEMFGGQQLESVTLLSGFDSERKLIYAEGVRGDDPHVLTEPELSAGIALALHPGTVKMPEDDATQSALTLGADLVRLNLDAIAISINQEDPSEEFTKRRDEIATQSGVEYAPMQMAYARWMVRGTQTDQTKKYLEAIHDNCSQIGEYYFLNAHFNYSQKNYTQAMKDIQTALEIQPQHPRWTLALARILYTQGKQAEAIKVCESLCKQYPENLTTAAYLLSLYKLTGNEEKLKQESQRLKDELNVETLPFDEKSEDASK